MFYSQNWCTLLPSNAKQARYTKNKMFDTPSDFPPLQVGTKALEHLPEPRMMKHHLIFEKSPYHPEAKYLVVMRNPFDTVVSFYHQCLADHVKMGMRADATFGEFFEEFMIGRVLFGSFFDYVLSWYAHRGDSNVCLLYYENLKENPAREILSVAEFLDQSIAERLRADAGLLDHIVEVTSFKYMKKNVAIIGKVNPEGKADKLGAFKTFNNFFRKGDVGDWKSHFNSDQERRLREVCEDLLRGTEMWEVWTKNLG